MRMWLCDPKILCQKHLCGEHVEMHMFLGSLKKGKKIDGFLKNNLFEPRTLAQRHEVLKKEMIGRGYNHNSDMCEEECECVLDLPMEKQYWEVDRKKALRDLLDRCPECSKRFSEFR
ncbi:MAG: pyrimidine dimer DNA glycosylase/endonuclease V [Vallitaleaceae bacterium]|nr:pyrimidine dimer DNA glycosylase/endonuclease V [Vallitaleaceae bacterium]